jgi:hypothetical protein
VRTPALLLAAALTAGCSTATTPPASSPPPPSSSTSAAAGPGRCQDVAQDGARVTDDLIDNGCVDDNGSRRVGKVTMCKDGRRLWEMGDLIGLSGETLLPRDLKAEGGVLVEDLARRACRG